MVAARRRHADAVARAEAAAAAPATVAQPSDGARAAAAPHRAAARRRPPGMKLRKKPNSGTRWAPPSPSGWGGCWRRCCARRRRGRRRPRQRRPPHRCTARWRGRRPCRPCSAPGRVTTATLAPGCPRAPPCPRARRGREVPAAVAAALAAGAGGGAPLAPRTATTPLRPPSGATHRTGGGGGQEEVDPNRPQSGGGESARRVDGGQAPVVRGGGRCRPPHEADAARLWAAGPSESGEREGVVACLRYFFFYFPQTPTHQPPVFSVQNDINQHRHFFFTHTSVGGGACVSITNIKKTRAKNFSSLLRPIPSHGDSSSTLLLPPPCRSDAHQPRRRHPTSPRNVTCREAGSNHTYMPGRAASTLA